MKRHFNLILPPGLTFSLVPADIFPWLLLNIGRIKKIKMSVIIFILLILSFGLYQAFSRPTPATFLMLFTYSYPMIVFFIFQSLSKSSYNRIDQIVFVLFISMVFIGIVQATGYFSNISLWSFLFPRGSLGNFSDVGGRGVSIFASEPSRAALELTFAYIFLKTQPKYVNKLWINIVYLFVIILLIKSIIGFFLALLFIAISLRTRLITLSVILLLTFIGLQFVNNNFLESNRILDVVGYLSSVSKFLNFIYEQSGHRAASLQTTYMSIFFQPLGYGIGNWDLAQLNAVEELGLTFSDHSYYRIVYGGQYVPQKSEGFIPNFFAELGVLGIFFITFWGIKFCKLFYRFSYSERSLAYFCILSLLFFAPVGHPYPFVLMGILYGKYKKK